MTWLTPARRLWIYGVVTALVPLAIGYGVVTSDLAPAWLALAAAVLGQGSIAMGHVPRADK